MTTFAPPQEILDILADPETKEPLELATQDELKHLRNEIENKRASRKNGQPIDLNFNGAFFSQQGTVAYLVHDDVPNFLIDERIEGNDLRTK